MATKQNNEIKVYMQANDSENPQFQCWLTLVVEKHSVNNVLEIRGKCNYGDEFSDETGCKFVIKSDYALKFFQNILTAKLWKTGTIMQGDCNSYAASITDFVIGVILGEGLYYNGNSLVIRTW